MIRKITILFLFVTLCCSIGDASEVRKSGNKWKTILTIVGAGGGFALGTFVGIAAYDDAIDSERKVFTTAFSISAAGGIAGYFLGRQIDKNHAEQEARVMPEIRWETKETPYPGRNKDSKLLRDADPIELLSRK